MSLGFVLGSSTVLMVCARSEAEMPVVTLSLASIETVKAVQWREVLLATISGIPNSSSLWPLMGKQISPRPYLAMKFIASGVIFSPAMAKSPSFSRDSSSTIITNLPAPISSIASEMLASIYSPKESIFPKERRVQPLSFAFLKILYIFGQDVHFQIDHIPGSFPS